MDGGTTRLKIHKVNQAKEQEVKVKYTKIKMKKLPDNEENNEVAVDEDSNDWRQLVEEAGAQGDYLAVKVEKYPLNW